jgi:hypothetical protein
LEIEQAARTAIAAIAGVSSVVGSRVYLDHRPSTSGRLSAVEVEVEDLGTPAVLDGGDGTGLAVARVRFVSEVISECESMASAVRASLVGFSGTWSGLSIDSVVPGQGDDDSWDFRSDASDLGVYSIESSYEVRFQLGG